MKFSKTISSKRRSQRKKHYDADSNKRRIIMSSRISKKLWKNYNTKTLPLRKGDEVRISRGIQKGKIGKIVQSSRKGLFVFVNSVTYKKVNGDEAYLPIHPSNVEIQKPVLTRERKRNFNINFGENRK